MNKNCVQCTALYEVTNDDLLMIERVTPNLNGEALTLPAPTHCPECRQQRRFACRNDRHYYSNTCFLCSKKLVSSYSEDKTFGVLCDSCFFSDDWNPLEYGKDYNFDTLFFTQFHALRESVPRLSIYHTQSENSEYTVHSSKNRNCYMDSSMIDCEDCHYSDLIFDSVNCLDLFSCRKMELCYESIFCEGCFQCDFIESCENLSDCMYCYDCKSSSNLVGCIGQRQAESKILNKPASQEEVKETIQKLKTDPEFQKKFYAEYLALKLSFPHRNLWMVNAENCSGTYIWNSKDVAMGFNIRDMEDVRYMFEGVSHKTTCDTTRIGGGEVLYECASNIDLKYSAFCNLAYQCSNLLYCDNCTGTEDSFGSISLKKHRYCILNKQYTEEEYKNLVPKIVDHMRSTGEWGEFFPVETSSFGYNETKAFEWFPLTKEEVQQRGWKWSDYELPPPQVEKSVEASRLPHNISDIPDDIMNWAILCEKSGKPFRIQKSELAFYRARNLPIPHLSPIERHLARIRPTNVRVLYDRTCAQCSDTMQTTYAPERPEIVYCEECYLKEVY